jgi:electron transfer flavoprotein alpha subunit
MILVIAEQRTGTLNRASWEAVAAAQQLASQARLPVTILVPGADIDAVARELAAASVEEVVALAAPALQAYTSEAYIAALAHEIAAMAPSFVVLAHTYQTRDFAPRLAVRLDRPFVSDVTAFGEHEGAPSFIRPMYQGRLAAEVAAVGPAPHLVSVQAGAFRADHVTKGSSAAAVRTVSATVPASAVGNPSEAPYQEARQTVDLTQAERIVSVGRGIKEESNIAVARQLAEALGAELAASRPICDAGWLPMARQVGSSGQTVAPRLYLALGISGAIQHLVGMKGARTIVAINKDPDAPIFEVADYGIVGDLFEVVPAMIAALK